MFWSDIPRLLPCHPNQEESLGGFLIRVSERNKLGNPIRLVKLFSRTGMSTLEALDVINLSILIGCDHLKLLNIVPQKSRSNTGATIYSMGRHLVGKEYFLNKSTHRICPECLAFGYIPLLWEFTLITCCPVHKVLLVERCPDCNKLFSWRRSSLSTCTCGRFLGTVNSKQASEIDLLFSSLIWSSFRRAVDQPYTHAINLRVSHWLSTLTLDGLFKTVFFFGGYVSAQSSPVPGHPQALKTLKGARTCLHNAYGFFKHWPHAFMEELDRRALIELPRRQSKDLPAVFRSIHRYVTEDLDTAELRQIVTIYESQLNRILAKHPIKRGNHRDSLRQGSLDF